MATLVIILLAAVLAMALVAAVRPVQKAPVLLRIERTARRTRRSR